MRVTNHIAIEAFKIVGSPDILKLEHEGDY